MEDLWAQRRQQERKAVEPLAMRMRPRTLAEFVGQEHILGPGKLLRRMLDADRLTSVIFFGPPGTGKTALAEVIAAQTGRRFERANAAMIGVKEIRRILDEAVASIESGGKRTILFLDEIHRFARNQQDVLLADVERGLITLIGATTENPYFAVNSALVSRSTILRFEPLSEAHIAAIVRSAIGDERGFPGVTIQVSDEAIAHWSKMSDGDARRALNALEVAVMSQRRPPSPRGRGDGGEGALNSRRDEDTSSTRGPLTPTLSRREREKDGDTLTPALSLGERGTHGERENNVVIDLKTAEDSIQAKALVYDGTGDEHYDIISALIKSMRGSDPDAAIYWLARMLEAGEDPRFIARRIAILASEDIGNADPDALNVAASAWLVTERVGMPECQLTLAQAVTYMACAPKSKAAATAIWSAAKDVHDGRTLSVPLHLRDAQYSGSEQLGHGENYVDPQQAADGYVSQDYLGAERVYYLPTDRGFEAEIRRRLELLKSKVASRTDNGRRESP